MPFSISWDIRIVAKGSEPRTVLARDAAGNTTTSRVAIIFNPGPIASCQPLKSNGASFRGTATFSLRGIGATVVPAADSALPAFRAADSRSNTNVLLTNRWNRVQRLAAAYSFREPGFSIQIPVTHSADDIVQTWTLTDQATLTLYRHNTLSGFSDSSALIRTRAIIYADGAGALDASIECYGRYR